VTTAKVIQRLKQIGDYAIAERKSKDFGITITNALGIYQKDLNQLVKEIGKNSSLAIELIDSEIYEARLLAAKLFRHQDLTESQMDEWVKFFDTWEMCDSFCMQIFKYVDFSWERIFSWSIREEEYVKRAAYVIMATYGQGHKETPNRKYETCYPIILRDAVDDRNFVKKAVNWAIREIGKRNVHLQENCIALCEEMLDLHIDSKSANWIAKNALKELQDPAVRIRNYPLSVYRR